MSNDPRPLIVEICHLLAARNFTSATGGNVSAHLPDGTCWVTPTSLHKARVRVEDLVRVDAECRVIEGTRKATSETLMHLALYRALPRAGAVIHAHPPAATGFTMAERTLDTSSSSEAVAILGRCIPLLPYMHPGTVELAEMVGRHAAAECPAYLLTHHGVLTWGTDLWQAYDILDTLELYAQSLIAATTLGGAVPLKDNELDWLEKKGAEIRAAR